MLFSSCPALPTNGSPCASSSAPGPSPTNIARGVGIPSAQRVSPSAYASGHRVQSPISVRTASSAAHAALPAQSPQAMAPARQTKLVSASVPATPAGASQNNSAAVPALRSFAESAPAPRVPAVAKAASPVLQHQRQSELAASLRIRRKSRTWLRSGTGLRCLRPRSRQQFAPPLRHLYLRRLALIQLVHAQVAEVFHVGAQLLFR